jgi:hypothetical protein
MPGFTAGAKSYNTVYGSNEIGKDARSAETQVPSVTDREGRGQAERRQALSFKENFQRFDHGSPGVCKGVAAQAFTWLSEPASVFTWLSEPVGR